MKFVQEYCSICNKDLAMPVVQEDDKHSSLIWVQCPACKEIKPIETGRAAQAAAPGPAPESGSPIPADDEKPRPGRRVVRHYRAGERFGKGEWIYHPEWDDTGQVVETERSGGGNEIIVVAFEKIGTKRLVSNFAG